MRVLVACEFSGTVRDAFRARGHDAWSCDLLPSETPGNHVVGDVRAVLADGWDLMVAHPPCTHLCVSGARWMADKFWETLEAVAFARSLLDAPIPRIALENPVGVLSTRIRKPDQIVQPWQFGDSFQKKTCLWLKGVPKLLPTDLVHAGEFDLLPNGKRIPSWYSKAGKDRQRIRSRTFRGIAAAMAAQWGNI